MGQGNIIGYEINEKTCQISFYNEEMAEPETMEVDADNYQIPLVIGKLRDTWAYGKEAKRLASLKEGFTVNRLLDKSLAGEKIEFGEESYEAVWLLAKFIELSLQSFPKINGIVFSVPELTEELAQMLRGIAVRILINGIFSFRITKRVSAIICFISQKNSGSMRRRCFAVTEMRLKRICSEG
jgi:hypothetical protein